MKTVFVVIINNNMPDVFESHDDATDFLARCFSFKGYDIEEMEYLECSTSREISDGRNLKIEHFRDRDIEGSIYERELREEE